MITCKLKGIDYEAQPLFYNRELIIVQCLYCSKICIYSIMDKFERISAVNWLKNHECEPIEETWFKFTHPSCGPIYIPIKEDQCL